MFLDINVPLPCSVSKEFVESIAAFDENNLILDGKPILNKVLFILGFDIRNSAENEDSSKVGHGVLTVRNVLIRNPAMPSEVYNTTVYNGQVRNEVEAVVDGIVTFQKNTPHYMVNLYINNEILTTENVSPELMQCITTIGDKHWYEGGMKTMSKRVDPNKKQRNIVR